jgi:hypothetical protein
MYGVAFDFHDDRSVSFKAAIVDDEQPRAQIGKIPQTVGMIAKAARIQAGAGFAASTSTRWICLFRCFDSGIHIALSAELLSSPHRPQ